MANINDLTNVEITGLSKNAFWDAPIKVSGEDPAGALKNANTNVSGYLSYLTNQLKATNEDLLKYFDNQFTIVSDAYGDDATAELYNIEKPFKTFKAAFDALDDDGLLLIKDGVFVLFGGDLPDTYGSKTANIYINEGAALQINTAATFENCTIRFFGSGLVHGNVTVREGGDFEVYVREFDCIGDFLMHGGNIVVNVDEISLGGFQKTDGEVTIPSQAIVSANKMRLGRIFRAFRPSNDRTLTNVDVKIRVNHLVLNSEPLVFDVREMQNINVSVEAEKIEQINAIKFFSLFEASGTRPIKNNQFIIKCKELLVGTSFFGDFVRSSGTASNFFNNNFIVEADYCKAPDGLNLFMSSTSAKFYTNAGGEQFSFTFKGNFVSESLPLINLANNLALNMVFEGKFQVFQDGVSAFQTTAGVVTNNRLNFSGCEIRNTGAAPISFAAATEVVVVKDARITNTVNANVNVTETQGSFLVY